LNFTVRVDAPAETTILNSPVVDPGRYVNDTNRDNNSSSTSTIVIDPSRPTATPVLLPTVQALQTAVAQIRATNGVPPRAEEIDQGLTLDALVMILSAEVDSAQIRPVTDDWLVVFASTPVYSAPDGLLGSAAPGAWYRVVTQEGGWVLGVADGDQSDAPVWIELDERVATTAA